MITNLKVLKLPLDIPVFIYHAKRDKVIPMKKSRARAEQLFSKINYQIVENDDHKLHSTVQKINWKDITY